MTTFRLWVDRRIYLRFDDVDGLHRHAIGEYLLKLADEGRKPDLRAVKDGYEINFSSRGQATRWELDAIATEVKGLGSGIEEEA